MAAVPEPSAWAILAGGLALVAVRAAARAASRHR
ncbi:MAG: PEP-CTERM sorting domain-containing protein [Pirellulales bacterium]